MGKRVRRGEKAQRRGTETVLRVMAGGGAGALVSILLLLGCSICISAGVVGERSMGAAVPACALAGGLCAGLIAARGMAGQRLPAGLCAGTAMFFVLLLAGLLMYEDASLENGGIGQLLACCCGAALASLPGRRSAGAKRR